MIDHGRLASSFSSSSPSTSFAGAEAVPAAAAAELLLLSQHIHSSQSLCDIGSGELLPRATSSAVGGGAVVGPLNRVEGLRLC